jgi:gas vesicle protein
MENESNVRFVSFLSGFVLGATVGVGLALLTAPQSGPRTRRRIRRAAGDLKESYGDRLDDLTEEVKDRVDDALSVAKRRLT